MKVRTTILAAALLGLAATGCSREPDRAPPVEEDFNAAVDTPRPDPLPDTPPPAPEPRAEPANVVERVPPAEDVPPDTQILDDADATGMTARLPAPDDSAPVEKREREGESQEN